LCSLPPAPAGAEPVQDFNVQIKDTRSDGRYSIVLTGNSYDTTGLRPPLVTDNAFRFPGGIRVRREFRSKAYQCDVDAVRDALRLPDGKRTYTQRLRNLAGTLRRTRSKLTPALAGKVKTCVRAQVGYGNSVADARPVFAEPTPANFFVYLAKPAVRSAEFTLTALVVLDEKGWLWKQAPLLRTFRLALNLNAFWRPGAGGPFGYRLVFPSGGTAGIRASVAEMKLTLTGLTRTKDNRPLFWLTRPTCSKSRGIRFESQFTYEGGTRQKKSIAVPCPRFLT
jgi:hypothetical protein